MINVREWLWIYWPRAEAIVVRYRIERSEGKPVGQKFYHPVVRFRTAKGQTIVAISSSGAWRRYWPRGGSVMVRYCPKYPQRIEVECFANLWDPPLTIAALLAMFVVIFWFKLAR